MATNAQIASQIEAANRLIDRAMLLVDDGDHSPYIICTSYTFIQGSNTPGELVFNVPNDADFYGTKLNLFLSSREVTNTGASAAQSPAATSDLVYQPARWTNENNWGNASQPFMQTGDANAVFELRDSAGGAYQTAPISINAAFSAAYGVNTLTAGTYIPITSYLGSLDFDIPYYIKRGNTATAKITPTFSTLVTTSRQLELRVTGLLSGFKKVRAFR